MRRILTSAFFTAVLTVSGPGTAVGAATIFSGTIEGGGSISFKVRGLMPGDGLPAAVAKVSVSYVPYTCTDNPGQVNHLDEMKPFNPPLRVENRRFKYANVVIPGVRGDWFAGRLGKTRKRASGSWRVQWGSPAGTLPYVCDTGLVEWRARHRPR